jgi:hypothetical protein
MKLASKDKIEGTRHKAQGRFKVKEIRSKKRHK